MTHTILVIDDSRDDLEITRRVLIKIGIALKIEEALSGEVALKTLRKSSELPGLILLDMKMPGMNGIETLREIRQDPRLKRIPVVILTNSTLDADKQDAQDAGADAFLHKAFDIDQFCVDLTSVLKRWFKE